MIKAGIIGLGKMGISHCAIVNAHPGVNLVGVCDTSTFVLEAFKKYSSLNCYTDYFKLIENENPDCIFVATPTKFHYDLVKYALEKGIHVFCEKPFCLTVQQGRELVEIAGRKRLVNQVGYHNHFVGTFREMKRLINSGILGEIYHFHGEAYGPVITKEKSGSWRTNHEEGGGCLFDYASHVLNLIQELVGLPVRASGTVLKSIYSKGVEDAVYSTLYLDNGISGQLSVNWSDETYRKMSTSLTVVGKMGKIICDATELKIYLKQDEPAEKLTRGWNIKYTTELSIPVDFYLRGEEYSAQIDYFIESIESKRIPEINSFQSGHNTDKVIDLIFNDSKIR
jgi:predicted dehydrogenase